MPVLGRTRPHGGARYVPALLASRNPGALSQWGSALSLLNFGPARWLAIGDGSTEGQGASTRANRWIDQALATIRTAKGAPSGQQFMSAAYGVTGPDSPWATTGVTYAGSTTVGTSAGIGYRHVQLSTTGGTAPFGTAPFGTAPFGGGGGGGGGFGSMSLSAVSGLRGVNWYGMEDGLRGPTLAELQAFVSRGYNFLRLPVAYDTTNATIATVLADAVTAKIWVGVEIHNYGRIGGTANINATDGTVITSSNQQTWFTKCTDQLAAFQGYASYVPLDMNEPKQTGAQWEPISQGRVSALRAAGWAGVIGVSAAKVSSAGGINNADAHPNGWWITDTKAFLEVHQYLQPLSDVTLQTRSQLDAWVVSSSGQSDLTTYAQYVARAFYWGAMGDSRWTNVPMLIGEFAMPPGCETELDIFLNQVDSRGVGAIEWGAGMWGTYNWKMTTAQYDVLSAHVVNAPALVTLTDDFTSLNLATWTSSGTPAPTIATGRLSIALSTSYPTITSTGYYNLTNSQLAVEVVQAPNTGPSTQAFFTLMTPAASKTGLEFVLDAATTLRARRWVNGSATEIASTAYSNTTHRWWRVIETGGSTLWQTSPDGTTWTTLGSVATSTLAGLGISITRLRAGLGAGHFQADANPGTALFDNLNSGAAPPPAVTSGSVTFTVTGTAADLWYVSEQTSGSFTYKVDSGTPVTVDTAAVHDLRRISGISLGASGSHTVAVSVVTGPVYVTGLTVYGADTGTGVHLYDAARTSATSATYASNMGDITDMAAMIAPDLVTIALGYNDPAAGISPAQTVANLSTLIAMLRSLSKVPSIMLVINPYPSGSSVANWPDFVPSLRRMAAIDSNLALLDLTLPMPLADTSGTGLYRVDGRNLNDTGHTQVASLFTAFANLNVTVLPGPSAAGSNRHLLLANAA
jgi:hypothetical protein